MTATPPAAPPPAGLSNALHGALRLVADLRWRLWLWLAMLSLLILIVLVRLAHEQEVRQVQQSLEQDTTQATMALNAALTRNVQNIKGLANTYTESTGWQVAAWGLLQKRRELLRLEWRDTAMQLRVGVGTPYDEPLNDSPENHELLEHDARQACALADRFGGPAYANARYMLNASGHGQEVMALCIPLSLQAQPAGYALGLYSMPGILTHLLPPEYAQRQSVALTETDGSHLAVRKGPLSASGERHFHASHLLDMPGVQVLLRLDGGMPLPDALPNLWTALVTLLALALCSVLALLARDVRARQKAEALLAEATVFRKAMEDSLITGLRARDLQGRTTYVNPAFCRMVGYTAQELIEQDAPPPYWPPELRQTYLQHYIERNQSAHVQSAEGVEAIFIHKNGSPLPVLVIEAPLRTAQGQHTGWVGAVLDLSAQRRAEEQLRTSQERLQASARLATLGEMASLLSHELNQPLAVISSYATGSLNLLADVNAAECPGGAHTVREVHTALTRIAEQAGRAGRVIHSVHDLVHRHTHAREAAHPAALVNAVMPLVQLQARKLQAELSLNVPENLPPIWCSPTMIEQVIFNLARNGLQAMQDQSEPRHLCISARLKTEPAPPHILFCISDTGSGITPEVAAQLYTPFFTTKPEGMGMGLPLCRTVIEQHGGHLSHTPAQPRGTRFCFSLVVGGHQQAETSPSAIHSVARFE